MRRFSRRDFFRASTALAAGAAIPAGPAALHGQRAARPQVRRFKPLGRTGWKVGDISAGSGQRDPGVFNYIFESGINLIDTGQQYGGHEELLGKVLPKWRCKVFVLDKWDPPVVTSTVTKSALLESLDVSLKRLNTTYIDCMMIHSIGHPRYGGIERIQNPAIYEAGRGQSLAWYRPTGAVESRRQDDPEMEWAATTIAST
jgi:hypothetical protein